MTSVLGPGPQAELQHPLPTTNIDFDMNTMNAMNTMNMNMNMNMLPQDGGMAQSSPTEDIKPVILPNGEAIEGDPERGRRWSRNHDYSQSRSRSGDHETGDGGDHSPDGPSRKRRRSRKTLDKKFECPHNGCGKSYSRAEHLYRHQLNHNPKQIYSCDFPDCTRTFVRLDLCNRHKDRHTAKGSALNRKDMLANQNHALGLQQAGLQQTASQKPIQQQQQQQHPHHQQPPPQQKFNPNAPNPIQIPNQTPGPPIKMSPSPVSSNNKFSMDPMSPDVKKPIVAFQKPMFQGNSHSQQQQQQQMNTFPASAPLHPIDGSFSGASIAMNRRLHQQHKQQQKQKQKQQQQQQMAQSPASMAAQRPLPTTMGMNSPYGVMSPVAGGPTSGFPQAPHSAPQNPVNFLSNQNFPAFNLPPSNFSEQNQMAEMPVQAQTPSFGPTNTMGVGVGEFGDSMATTQHLAVMEQMQTMPMFGSEGLMNKSPYVSMPTDLINYLFSGSSPITNQLAYQNGGFSSYSQMYMGPDTNGLGYFTNLPQQVMAVTNLLEQQTPEATLSGEKSQEIFDYIKLRFIERDEVPDDRRGDELLQGDRTQPSHMLSKRMMQAYIRSYWVHFSDQVPILHQPSFSPDCTPILLLLSMMSIGAACLDKTKHGDQVAKAGAQLSNFFAWHIRWEAFMDRQFRPPAKLWAFQALLLLEIYEKMYSTRELHERALIHHATTIAMMRRGRALIGKPICAESPMTEAASMAASGSGTGNGAGRSRSRNSSTPGPGTNDEWWNQWIINESTRRTAFAAFVVDSIHATMFGHSTVMVAHEMRLPLPCDESLWRATSGSEVGRLEAVMISNGIKPIAFLEGLKRTLQGHEVQTNYFGRTVLMAGLLSVSWHMRQRDMQVNVLGSDVTQSLGGRDRWRLTLTKAFDWWKQDFDKAIDKEQGGNPYSGFCRGRDDHQFNNVVFESRTVLHHLAHMAMHVDVIDCQMFARAKRLLGRSIGDADLRGAQRRMKDQWAPTAKARDATWYALNFLCSVLMPEERGLPRPPNFDPANPYSARDDVLVNRPWVVYLAALVVWCYGYALEGPCRKGSSSSNGSNNSNEEQRGEQEDGSGSGDSTQTVHRMKEYLRKYGNIGSPDELVHMQGLNGNTALLLVLKKTFEQTRWQLLHEGAILLNNCIMLNRGMVVS